MPPPTGATRPGTGPAPPEESGLSPERVTVNLTGLSVQALTDLANTRTGMTKTDAINKALQFYWEIKKIIADGGAMYIREAGETEPERVRIF
jgi:hypothetical protein